MAAVRLRDIQEEYGDLVTVSWRSMPLRLGDQRGTSSHSLEGRQRAREEEPRLAFSLQLPADYPASSLPALQAGKCAQRQGEAAFHRMHMALFRAYFEESLNIASREVLAQVAQEVGLDETRFWADMDSGQGRSEIIQEFREFLAGYAGYGIPLAVFAGVYPVVGAVPVAVYSQVIDKLHQAGPKQ